MSKHDLLVKPFEEKRYVDHRKKVELAAPVVDNNRPLERLHITTKLKKQLWEQERKHDIQKENFRLLQQLNRIMEVNRLDNNWKKPQYGRLKQFS